jgi:hypothetical protein
MTARHELLYDTEAALRLVDSELDELRGDDDAIEGVKRILSDGDAPARQRQIHAKGGMSALLRHLATETSRGLAPPGPR